MFRFSKDEFIAGKQREKADDLFVKLINKCSFEHSPAIEKFFDSHVRSYEFLEELPKLSIRHDDPIVMPAITTDAGEYHGMMDLKKAFDKLNKPWRDTIPYIEFSFPEDYKCPHGDSFMHVFLFFFTQYHEFDGAESCTLHYLNKLNKLKVFL